MVKGEKEGGLSCAAYLPPPILDKAKIKTKRGCKIMDNEKTYCPLLKGDCAGVHCMWFVVGLDRCAINSIAQSLDAIEGKTDYKEF